MASRQPGTSRAGHHRIAPVTQQAVCFEQHATVYWRRYGYPDYANSPNGGTQGQVILPDGPDLPGDRHLPPPKQRGAFQTHPPVLQTDILQAFAQNVEPLWNAP